MKFKFFIGLLCTVVFAFAGGTNHFPKSYYQIKSTAAQKAAFVKIMQPLIVKAESNIEKERQFVKDFFDNFTKNGFADPKNVKHLAKLAKKYRIKKLFDESAYLKRIDTIPVSLILAQASIESSWGKSRFAREANNLFGEWTWGEHGLIPKNRPEGKTYRVRIFKTLEASVNSYMLNLNRHWAYKTFREARAQARKRQQAFTGLVAAQFLQHYSQMGMKYTRIVRATIRKHGWGSYDRGAKDESASHSIPNELAMLL